MRTPLLFHVWACMDAWDTLPRSKTRPRRALRGLVSLWPPRGGDAEHYLRNAGGGFANEMRARRVQVPAESRLSTQVHAKAPAFSRARGAPPSLARALHLPSQKCAANKMDLAVPGNRRDARNPTMEEQVMKKQRRTAVTVITAVAAFGLWTGTASAQPGFGGGPPHGGPGALREADANNDGQVTYEELAAVDAQLTQERFAWMDRNGDGVLTPEDRPERPEGPGPLREADANDDGQVTYEELAAIDAEITQERFAQLDRNGDGVLTPEDHPRGPGGPGGPGPLREADTNEDGQVTYEELAAVDPELTQERFSMLDRNSDGVLTPDDRPRGPRGGRDCPAE